LSYQRNKKDTGAKTTLSTPGTTPFGVCATTCAHRRIDPKDRSANEKYETIGDKSGKRKVYQLSIPGLVEDRPLRSFFSHFVCVRRLIGVGAASRFSKIFSTSRGCTF
jgi:hypothetical protein